MIYAIADPEFHHIILYEWRFNPIDPVTSFWPRSITCNPLSIQIILLSNFIQFEKLLLKKCVCLQGIKETIDRPTIDPYLQKVINAIFDYQIIHYRHNLFSASLILVCFCYTLFAKTVLRLSKL